VIPLVYVGDGLFLGDDKALVDSKKHACLKHWECHDTGDVTDFLGMKVNKTASCIMINQKAYLTMVLERFNMHNAKITSTPIPLGYVPQENKEAVNPVNCQKFQSVIGSLLYLMLGTHPDIAFMVIKMSQLSANPSQDHLDKAMYIMHYLVGTQNYHMVYDGNLNEGLIAHTDSDWASDPIKWQSTTGFFASLSSSIVCWQSCLQKTVVLSSTKAKYMALLDTHQQIAWIQSLFQQLGYNLAPTPICGDNQGLIFIRSNLVQEWRTKHIDIQYHYICECIEDGKVSVYFIPGNENLANMFTKNLGTIDFLHFRKHRIAKYTHPLKRTTVVRFLISQWQLLWGSDQQIEPPFAQ